jgi:hypothetical protein
LIPALIAELIKDMTTNASKKDSDYKKLDGGRVDRVE